MGKDVKIDWSQVAPEDVPTQLKDKIIEKHPVIVNLSNDVEDITNIQLPMKIEDFPIADVGVWKGLTYTPQSIQFAFHNTNWEDSGITSIYLDHLDRMAGMIAGKITNPRLSEDGMQIKADIMVSNADLARAIKLKTRVGVSPKFIGNADQHNVMHEMIAKNFAFVVNPGMRTLAINNSEEGIVEERELAVIEPETEVVNRKKTVEVENGGTAPVVEKKESDKMSDKVKDYVNDAEFVAYFREAQEKNKDLDIEKAIKGYDKFKRDSSNKELLEIKGQLTELAKMIKEMKEKQDGNLVVSKEVTTGEVVKKSPANADVKPTTDTTPTVDTGTDTTVATEAEKKPVTVENAGTPVDTTNDSKELDELKLKYTELLTKVGKIGINPDTDISPADAAVIDGKRVGTTSDSDGTPQNTPLKDPKLMTEKDWRPLDEGMAKEMIRNQNGVRGKK